MAIELHVEPGQFNFEVLARLFVLELELVFRQVDHGVILAHLHQHLLAVGRDLITAHVAVNGLFAIFEAIGAQMITAAIRAGLVVIAAIIRHGPAQVENAIAHHPQAPVVGGRNIERNEPVVNPVEVYFDRDRFLRSGFFVFVVFLGVVTMLLIRFGLVLIFVFILVLVVGLILVFVLLLFLADFIAPRSE